MAIRAETIEKAIAAFAALVDHGARYDGDKIVITCDDHAGAIAQPFINYRGEIQELDIAILSMLWDNQSSKQGKHAMNPRFENITEMENNALGEEDNTCNLQLKTHVSGVKVWLRVVAYVTLPVWAKDQTFDYFLDAKRSTPIDREQAQRYIDHEWGKL